MAVFRNVKQNSENNKSKPKILIAQSDPEMVLRAFNTWAFKREQPSDLPLLRRNLAAVVARREPIPFVLYWGKGPRATFADPERQCLAFLAAMAGRIAAVYPQGVWFHFVYTDTHARLNQHAAPTIESYHQALIAAVASLPASCHRLSGLIGADSETTSTGERPAPEVLERLQTCAAKWYRGEGGALEGAERYFALNMSERQAIGRCFPEAVFLTFNGSEYRSLFPAELPVFYMYSLRKGVSAKPWFLPEGPAHAQAGGTAALASPDEVEPHAAT